MLFNLYSKYEKKKILGLMLKTDKFQKNETDKTRNKFIEKVNKICKDENLHLE